MGGGCITNEEAKLQGGVCPAGGGSQGLDPGVPDLAPALAIPGHSSGRDWQADFVQGDPFLPWPTFLATVWPPNP